MNGGHFKLGLFVSVAVVLLVAFLLALGVLDRFKPKIEAETYFHESIQNLQTGAAVRFRGVQIGSVGRIGFARTEYTEAARIDDGGTDRSDIMVKLVLYSETIAATGVDDVEAFTESAVKSGLRARLATTGLGGPTFIEIDYLDPDEFPQQAISWTPASLYIPSAPSTVVSIIDGLARMLRRVEEVKLIDEFAALGDDLEKVLAQVEDSELLSTTSSALEELRAASAEARALLADPRIDTIIDDAQATLEGARTLLESDHGEVETLIQDMTKMAETLDRAGTSLDTLATTVNDSNMLAQMESLADELGPAGRDLSDLAKRLDGVIKGNEDELADTIRSLRNAALELEALLEELKANPARILADPPPKGPPGGGS
jgi:ABC-type transporter Mla subunit MlaD